MAQGRPWQDSQNPPGVGVQGVSWGRPRDEQGGKGLSWERRRDPLTEIIRRSRAHDKHAKHFADTLLRYRHLNFQLRLAVDSKGDPWSASPMLFHLH